jgi:acid phosphatase type 7
MKKSRGKFRAAVLMGAAASVLVFASGAAAQNQNSQGQSSQGQNSNNSWPYATTGRSPVLAVVGDVACQPDEDFVAGGGESAHETCGTPKAPYSSTSLFQSQ